MKDIKIKSLIDIAFTIVMVLLIDYILNISPLPRIYKGIIAMIVTIIIIILIKFILCYGPIPKINKVNKIR